MQYQLIRESDYTRFNMAVNNFLRDDWELCGETKILIEKSTEKGTTLTTETTFYYQVMVK